MNEKKVRDAVGTLCGISLGLRGLADLLMANNEADPTAGALIPSIELLEVVTDTLEKETSDGGAA
jgi:hypothetical protein